jgi:hypothetical protein
VSNPLLPTWVSGVAVEADGGGYRVTFVPAGQAVPYLTVSTSAVSRVDTLVRDTPSALKGANTADYVVITTADLAEPSRALAAYRGAQGLRPLVIDVQDIYDEFNGGVASPHAIRQLLAYAYGNWSSAPRYVLLAGAGSFDYKNYQGYADSLVPPTMVATFDGLSAADSRYGDVSGDDGAPEIAVGRLPVMTAAELQAYVSRIETYEAADSGGGFGADSDVLAATLPPAFEPTAIYLGPLSREQARTQLLAALDVGAGVLSYVGHGGLDTLAAEGLLIGDDVPGLLNAPRLPFMAAATCVVGDYSLPGSRPLGARLALQADGGMAAVFAPTGASFNVDGVALGALLFQELFAGSRSRIGDATRASLWQYAADGGPRYVLDTYNLLGDPAMEMRWR